MNAYQQLLSANKETIESFCALAERIAQNSAQYDIPLHITDMGSSPRHFHLSKSKTPAEAKPVVSAIVSLTTYVGKELETFTIRCLLLERRSALNPDWITDAKNTVQKFDGIVENLHLSDDIKADIKIPEMRALLQGIETAYTAYAAASPRAVMPAAHPFIQPA